MSLIHSEYRARIDHWQRVLAEDFYHPLEEIHFEGFTTMEHLTPEQAQCGPFVPFDEGTQWGRTWEYLWLRASVTLPRQAEGKPVVLSLDMGGEATLFVNGQTFGTRRAEWVSVPHHYISDNVLTLSGEEGMRFDLLFEVYAGHYFPDVGGCATGPVLPGTLGDPKEEGRRARVGRSTFGIWNEDAYQLWLDVSTLQMLMDELPEDSLRAARIADGLEAYTRIVDFEQSPEGRIADYRRARQTLRPLMEAKNGSTVPTMAAVGNAHLDLAWLWPQRETHRKTARTFAAQLRLLDRYPEYRFIQSQPAAYEMCREHYPELYERIRAAVRQGRWIAEGAMYVEPDTNMPSGEALIRQLVFGKRFYKDELGVDSRLLWLPDTFGYTAALPQILRGCGVDYLVTQKIFWSYNEGDPFPYHYFRWKGMDGSCVTSFLPTSYTYRTDPKELCGVWRSRVQKRHLEDFLVPFGYGDGGGGPCRDFIEYALRERDLEGMPRVEMTSPLAFFEDLEQKGGPVHTWDGELYFNAHRGTYTTQAAIKANNRRSEFALHDLEAWGALAALHGHAYPRLEAERLWKTLLLHQFHDILPGSSIAKVYEEANAAHRALQEEAAALTRASCEALTRRGEGLALFNSLGFEREEVVSLPESLSGGVCTAEGTPVPVSGGKALVRVPALGVVSLVSGEAVPPEALASAELIPGGALLRTGQLEVRLNDQGQIVSYTLGGRRMTADRPMNALTLYKDVPRLFDAWDIDSNYREQACSCAHASVMKVDCAAGLTASLVWEGTIGRSSIRQTVSVTVGSPVVTFDTTIQWHELHRLLKVAFPVDVRAEHALHEMQFGYVERPTHRSRGYDQQRFEVCNHRYTALCDNGHGCAVLNDCKYGVGVEQNSIELTLLRAAASPEMASDQGEHRFRYGFTAWEGDFLHSPVVRQGLCFNEPLTVLPGTAPRMSAFWADQPNVIVDTLKPADDGSGDLIVRLYESKKADTFFRLLSGLPVRALQPCDMLENPVGECLCADAQLHVTPFQILTLRVKIA
ncbi:MAG: glycoside hydrolase family 38 C-terminal domain-containing protein [Clostridia bacterium]|nr:glycoside hydrolase family 38 C-terminal domain-containing protein [Clostridia bacterium]